MTHGDDRPVVAISSCLLGNRVRYDGKLKHFPHICNHLGEYFRLQPVCPEVEIGLSIPRPALILAVGETRPRMIGRDDASLDVSADMYRYCAEKPHQLNDIAGYVFKARSPSCGLRNLALHEDSYVIDQNIRGLFAESVTTHFPQLPVADEEDLLEPTQREQFIEQVLNYYSNQRIQ